MDLIRDDPFVMGFSQLHQLFQLRLPPDPSHRIVGIAEDYALDLGVRKFFGKVGKVHGIAAILIEQGAGDNPAAVAFDLGSERRVDRGLDDDAFTWLGQEPDEDGKSRDDTGGKENIPGGHIPVVAAPEPAGDSPFQVFIVIYGIAEDPAVEACLQRHKDRLRRSKVHIGDPGQNGILCPAGRGPFQLHGVGAGPVDDLVKIILHVCPPLKDIRTPSPDTLPLLYTRCRPFSPQNSR